MHLHSTVSDHPANGRISSRVWSITLPGATNDEMTAVYAKNSRGMSPVRVQIDAA